MRSVGRSVGRLFIYLIFMLAVGTDRTAGTDRRVAGEGVECVIICTPAVVVVLC